MTLSSSTMISEVLSLLLLCMEHSIVSPLNLNMCFVTVIDYV